VRKHLRKHSLAIGGVEISLSFMTKEGTLKDVISAVEFMQRSKQ
jgi:hypothetical protein